MKGAVIFGLDGVLANNGHRRPADGQNLHWRKQYDQNLIEDDPPHQQIVQLCKQLAEVNDIVVVSERPLAVMEASDKWLKSQGLDYDVIYMKQDLFNSSPADCKIKLVHDIMGDNWTPWLLVDCDPDVIRRFNGRYGIQGILV